MMLKNMAEWRKRVIDESIEEEKGNIFRLIAIYSREVDGFIVNGSIMNKSGEYSAGVWVSSQRQERRVFKTLDALRRAAKSVDIQAFEVSG